LLPPVFLDYYLNDQGGYDVPRLPYAVSGSPAVAATPGHSCILSAIPK